jgi:hypothetical protein
MTTRADHPHFVGNYEQHKETWMSFDWNTIDDPLEIRVQWRESRKSNAALHEYALMGAGRSLRAVHEKFLRQEKFWQEQKFSGTSPAEKPPTTKARSLQKWSKEYRWVDRCRRWDEIQARKAVVSYEEDRVVARRARLDAAKGAFETVAQALLMLREAKFKSRIGPTGETYPPAILSEVTLPAVISSLEKAMDMLRKEFGEDVDRVDVTSGGQPIRISEVIVERGVR